MTMKKLLEVTYTFINKIVIEISDIKNNDKSHTWKQSKKYSLKI